MSTMNGRAIAATILTELVRGQGSLTTHLPGHRNSEAYSLLQETCYGCCRWYHLLSRIVDLLVSKPLKDKDTDLKSLLIVGLYQLRELSIPDHAVINESVSAATQLGKPWAKSLINAVLRNYLRNKEKIEQELQLGGRSVSLSHPAWLLERIDAQWPHQADQILGNNNRRPPMTLRVNRSRRTAEQMLSLLADNGIDAWAGPLTDSAVYLRNPVNVETLPGFRQGWLSVQDEASQLVPGLLGPAPGMRVLDACAAPGGKTCHIIESEHSLAELVALDLDCNRLQRVAENLDRLHLEATLRCADASTPSQWWDGEPFDRILLDAPCSATGVIRRHPDIKLLRSPGNLASLNITQRRLLHSLWPCLKPDGILLYTTCSILREENEAVVEEFLRSADNAKYEGIAADWGVECRYGRQLLTGAEGGPDGFFYALLRKE